MMAVVAARELADGEVVFVGIGLPNLACNLARRTHAPNLVLIYESGAVGATPSRLPVSIGDLVLAGLYPGIEATEVRAGVGWKLESRARLNQLDPPTTTELHLLREVLDPQRLYLKS